MSNAEYICHCEKGSLRGEGNTEEERKIWVRKWLIVLYCEFQKAGETNSLMSESWKEKNREGKEAVNRKDVAREHMSSQETYTLRKYYDRCYVCVSVCVCACVNSRWCQYELSHSLFTMTPHWQLQRWRTCLKLRAFLFSILLNFLDKVCVYVLRMNQ